MVTRVVDIAILPGSKTRPLRAPLMARRLGQPCMEASQIQGTVIHCITRARFRAKVRQAGSRARPKVDLDERWHLVVPCLAA